MRIIMQTPFSRVRQRKEFCPDDGTNVILSDRYPDINKIADMFFQGKPLDGYDNQLIYNEIERNPLLTKGFDLAELPALVKQIQGYNGDYEKAIAEALEKHSTHSQQISNLDPSVTPPEQITE